MGELSEVSDKVTKRSEPKVLESKIFRDGAIYLYRRSDYKKPTWFIRLKVPGVKGYLWKSSKTADEHAAYKVADDWYNQSLGRLYSGVKLDVKRIGPGIDAFVKAHQDRQTNVSIKYTVSLANRLKPLLQNTTFDEIDASLISKMLETISTQSRKGSLSLNTLKRTQGHIKLLMGWWVDNGYLEKIPTFPKASTGLPIGNVRLALWVRVLVAQGAIEGPKRGDNHAPGNVG